MRAARTPALRLWSCLLATGLAWSGLVTAHAAAAEAASAASAAEDAAAEADADPTDSLVVPAGDAADMLAFIRQTMAATRTFRGSPSERAQFQLRASAAILAAADQGLAAEVSVTQAASLTRAKLNALSQLKLLSEMEEHMLIDQARQDERPQVASIGWRAFAIDGARDWSDWSRPQRARWRKSMLTDWPSNSELAEVRAVALRMAVSRLAMSDADAGKQFVAEAIEAVRGLHLDSDKIQEVLVDLEGTLRRLDLVGNKMEITGTLIDGQTFDWEAYRGKVVLVDYWATWCGPCRAELPNVKRMYAAYHDKGFDVVGISLDTSKEKTEKFLADNEIPWATLYGVDQEHDGWDHPMALRYGISGIPTAILVDQNGVGVNLKARGNVLREQLQQLLGDPIEPPAEAAGDAETDPADEAA
ncbi:MAG: TlpA family protein disulfide reductase [Planctomycetales bacterium]|nr:TlpA family protein disulfide reductase [Planctomycetales bacterium]